jgi:hypothetical protein
MSIEYGAIHEPADVRIRRNEHGDPVAVIAGTRIVLGHILSVFPISNREGFVSLRDLNGDEIGVIERPTELDAASRHIVLEELGRSYFLPLIQDIFTLTDDLNVITWNVLTDKGPRTFEVRDPRRNVRSVGGGRYIVKDVDGNRYDIPRLSVLPPRSQALIREFV